MCGAICMWCRDVFVYIFENMHFFEKLTKMKNIPFEIFCKNSYIHFSRRKHTNVGNGPFLRCLYLPKFAAIRNNMTKFRNWEHNEPVGLLWHFPLKPLSKSSYPPPPHISKTTRTYFFFFDKFFVYRQFWRFKKFKGSFRVINKGVFWASGFLNLKVLQKNAHSRHVWHFIPKPQLIRWKVLSWKICKISFSIQ